MTDTNLSVLEAAEIMTMINAGTPSSKAIQAVAPRFMQPGAIPPSLDEIQRKSLVWDGITQQAPLKIPEGTPEPAPTLVPIPYTETSGSSPITDGFLNLNISSDAWNNMSTAQQVYMATVVTSELTRWMDSDEFERLALHNIG